MNLPLLTKKPGKSYVIGVDVEHNRGTEMFTFCIMEICKNETPTIIHIDQVANSYKYETDKKYLQYIESLEGFYRCPILIEVN